MSRSVAEDFAALEEMKKNEETDERKFQVFQFFVTDLKIGACIWMKWSVFHVESVWCAASVTSV